MSDSQKQSGSNKKKGVTVILIRPSGKMLLQLRDDGGGKKIGFPNRWCFPGGGKECDEEYIDTAIREMAEEFDIKIEKSDCELLMVYSYLEYKDYHVFVCRVDENLRPRLQEGDGMRWATMDQIKKIGLAELEDEIIPKLESYLKSI